MGFLFLGVVRGITNKGEDMSLGSFEGTAFSAPLSLIFINDSSALSASLSPCRRCCSLSE
jgi:hypothetical protein